MKSTIIKITCKVLLLFVTSAAFSQYNWKLSKDKDGIRVYQSEIKTSNFKSIKVECTLQGTYDKLISLLSNVSHHKEWVYNSKTSFIFKKNSSQDFYYYSETSLPWPMSNRDAVVHLTMYKDSLNRFLKISAIGEPNLIPEKSGKVRVPRSSVSWYVTMPTAKTINIVYTFEADPGGSLPSWIVNMFADKGPYESFKKLAEILKQ
jgi:START domain-containing protein